MANLTIRFTLLTLRQRQEIRTPAVRISCFFVFFLKFERVGRRLATNDFILRTRKIKSPAGKETFLSPQGLIVNKITVIRTIRRFLIFQKYNAVCRGSSCRTRSLRSGNNKYKPCNACNFCPIRVFRRLIGYY